MDVLVDTGVLLRLIIPSDPGHVEARRAIKLLRRRGDKLITLTQNASEFWNVCTSPVTVRGGYGLSIERLERSMKLTSLIENTRRKRRIVRQYDSKRWQQLSNFR